MHPSWQHRTNPYAPAIEAAQDLLHSRVPPEIFEPVVGFLRRSPMKHKETYASFLAEYFPEAVLKIAHNHQSQMQRLRLKRFGIPSPTALTGPIAILSPEQAEEALRTLLTGADDVGSYYGKTQKTEEWARILYDRVRLLSEGNTHDAVRVPISTTEIMLDEIADLVARERNIQTRHIDSDNTEFMDALFTEVERDRTDTLLSAIAPLNKVLEPIYTPLLQQRGQNLA